MFKGLQDDAKVKSIESQDQVISNSFKIKIKYSHPMSNINLADE